MQPIYYTFLVIVGVLLLYFVVEAVARMRTSALRDENRRLRSDANTLADEIRELRSSEPDKVRKLREELAAYSNLVDDLLAETARMRSDGLSLASVEERFANIIRAHRPDRQS